MRRSVRVTSHSRKWLACWSGALAVAIFGAARSGAFPTYSTGTNDRCRACHGDFRAANYISLSDGENWGSLHNLHRQVMLNNDCEVCHTAPGEVPVYTNFSGGGIGFDAIGCVGCHGRAEDVGKDTLYGAGLRQHHTRAGVELCMGCHIDADPAEFTPVPEDVAPPYYFLPDPAHPNKPTMPCNLDAEENYAGDAEGLDNDGNDVYDGLDPACGTVEGDANGDGCVSFADIVVILNQWGQTGEGLSGDVNGDGTVSFPDLVVVLGNWGFGCG